MHEEPAGSTRTRKVYTITDEGRTALADWTDSEPAPPTFEAEAMVRLLFAEHGTVEDLARALTKLRDDTEELHRWSLSIIDGYAHGDIPFPDRLHLSVLLASFELELFTMIERWADFAIDEVSRWDDTDRPGPGARTDEITSMLAERRTVLADAAAGVGPGSAP